MATLTEDEQFYSQIEKKHKFSIPEDYRKVRDRGFMTLNGPARHTDFQKARDHYLWLNDMEWYRPKEIAEFAFNKLYNPHLPNLVPFAFTGGGDWWCWQTDHQTKKWGTRILLCNHDDGQAIVYAGNFRSALFRQALALASASGYWFLKGRVLTSEDKKRTTEIAAFLRRYSVDLGLIFPAEWCALLSDLASRTPFWWKLTVPNGRSFDCFSVLSDLERKKFEKEYVAFAEMDKESGCLFRR